MWWSPADDVQSIARALRGTLPAEGKPMTSQLWDGMFKDDLVRYHVTRKLPLNDNLMEAYGHNVTVCSALPCEDTSAETRYLGHFDKTEIEGDEKHEWVHTKNGLLLVWPR